MLSSSPPQRLLLGIPMKIAIIVKIESARRMMGRGKRRKPFFSLPLPIGPQRSLFLSPQSRYNTKRPLRRREVGAGLGAEE